MRRKISDEYFEWLYHLMCDGRFGKGISYRRLLIRLHDTRFRYSIRRDQNRAEDGIDLRRRFALIRDYEDSYERIMDCLDGPCSILEMMVALAIRCEETIMDDPIYGDRTGQWFWGMINSLGLGGMIDTRFEDEYVDDVIERFLKRDYEPDGTGGLFTIRRCEYDLRTVEIWCQLCWYLDTIT